MRTTLSIDEDVAIQLEAWREKQALSRKQAVNTALRRGLLELNRPNVRRPVRTKAVDLGQCRIPSLDNVHEVLDQLEIEARDRR
jgi:hypothetical protein